MKNLIKFFGIVVMAMLVFTSCQKDDSNDLREVSFGIENVSADAVPSMLKTVIMGDQEPTAIECSDAEPVYAKIVIDEVVYEPEVFELNGKLYTQAIKLPSGEYSVSSFELLDVNEVTIMATPATESVYADYVAETVPFQLNVSVFDKTERGVEVLCYNISEYDNFGFSWMNVGQVSVHELLFYGDVCIDPALYEGSVYGGDLTNYPFDIPAIFEIRTFVDGEPLKVFSNEGEKLGPLAAEYYTHSNKVLTFDFELWVYLYNENTQVVELTLVDVLTFDSDNPLTATDVSNVIDFVIGDCVYTPSQLTYTKSTSGWVEQNTLIVEETNWVEETAFAGDNVGNNGTGWFHYHILNGNVGGAIDPAGPIYAGQELVQGASISIVGNQTTEHYTVTIDLGDNMVLQDVSEAVKIQSYANAPTSRPAAGEFTTYKGNDLVLTLPYGATHEYWVIHLDVEVNK